MFALLSRILLALRSSFEARAAREAEILVFRQQLLVLSCVWRITDFRRRSAIRHTQVVRHIAGDHCDPFADVCDRPPAGAEHAESGLMKRLRRSLPDSRK